jgi:cell division protein FtsI/penicillin-binding protein 2
MASLYASIANKGTWIQPHITAAIGGKPTTGWVRRKLVTPHVAAELTTMLTRVVSLNDGTGPGTGTLAQIPGYTVAGKTGTTPKYDAKHDSYCDPYKGHCEYQTSFVGFAPASHPRFVALVMVDQPQSKNPYDIEGGTVAAPIFKSIAQGILQILQVKPDNPRALTP